MSKRLRVAAAQIAASGDIPANARRIVDEIERAAAGRADLLNVAAAPALLESPSRRSRPR